MRRASGKGPLWARLLVTVGAVMMVVSGVTLAGGRFLVARYAARVHQARLLGTAAVPVQISRGPMYSRVTGPINILLVGIDERADDPVSGARSDTIIIVHIPASHDHAYLISLPRDSRVEIPPYPKTGYPGGTDKINAAFAFGFGGAGFGGADSGVTGSRADGFELLALTIRRLAGIRLDAGAIVNFDGLREVVDAVGGVELCVDEETTSVHIGHDAAGKTTVPYRQPPPDFRPVPVPGVSPQVYHVGCQPFTGWQALDYVRQRELIPDGDYGRQRHQQQLVTALVKKIAGTGTLSDPLSADRILRSLGSAVTFDGNGVSLANWIFTLKSVDPGAITMLKSNAGQFNSQRINGQDFEILTDTSRQLLAALRDDAVGGFVAAHPDWVVANSSATQ